MIQTKLIIKTPQFLKNSSPCLETLIMFGTNNLKYKQPSNLMIKSVTQTKTIPSRNTKENWIIIISIRGVISSLNIISMDAPLEKSVAWFMTIITTIWSSNRHIILVSNSKHHHPVRWKWLMRRWLIYHCIKVIITLLPTNKWMTIMIKSFQQKVIIIIILTKTCINDFKLLFHLTSSSILLL